jgi:hypothetical protein
MLVIRRNHQTGAVSLDPLRWGLIPYWCEDPKGGRKPIKAKCETVQRLPTFRDLSPAALHRPGRWLLRVEGDQRPESQATLCHRHEGRQPVRQWTARTATAGSGHEFEPASEKLINGNVLLR